MSNDYNDAHNMTYVFVCVKGPFTRAIFLSLTQAIEWLSPKSIDLYSFAQMV